MTLINLMSLINFAFQDEEKTEEKIEQQLSAENTPEVYWKNLAEERRVSLEKALEENKDLSELLQVKKMIFQLQRTKEIKI